MAEASWSSFPKPEPRPTRSMVVPLIVASVVALALVLGLAINTVVSKQREEDRRVDEIYCTLSGIGLLDRGPKTGERCLDLLGY